MSIVARNRTYQFSQSPSPSWTLLVQLSGAHDHLLQEIGNFGQVTNVPTPDSTQFAAARWRLSQASLRRRSMSVRVIEFLSVRDELEDLPQLAAFKTADQMMMRRSAQHVHEWTMRTIFQNWNSYCIASHDIRALMKTHVELEQRSIYPLLERLSTCAKNLVSQGPNG